MTSWNWIFIFSWLDVISALIKLFKSSFFIQSEDHLKIWIFYCCKKWPTNQHQHWSGWWWFAWENFRYWCLAELSLLSIDIVSSSGSCYCWDLVALGPDNCLISSSVLISTIQSTSEFQLGIFADFILGSQIWDGQGTVSWKW